MAYSLTWDVTGYDFTEEAESCDWDDSTQLATELVPRRHGALITEEPVLAPRRLTLMGMIVSATDAACETRYSLLAKQLNAGAKQLRFNGLRYITCYKKGMEARPVESTGLIALKYAIEFMAVDPFWYSTSATSADQVASYGVTAWSHTNSGDAMVWPTITFLANQGVAVTPPISLTNSTTGQTFTYSGTIASGQNLVVNCANFTVQNNGTTDLANSSGSFIQLNSGSNSMSYSGPACTVRLAYTQRFFGPTWS